MFSLREFGVLRVAADAAGPISIGVSSSISGPGSVYCTNGFKCQRRIFAASTIAHPRPERCRWSTISNTRAGRSSSSDRPRVSSMSYFTRTTGENCCRRE